MIAADLGVDFTKLTENKVDGSLEFVICVRGREAVQVRKRSREMLGALGVAGRLLRNKDARIRWEDALSVVDRRTLTQAVLTWRKVRMIVSVAHRFGGKFLDLGAIVIGSSLNIRGSRKGVINFLGLDHKLLVSHVLALGRSCRLSRATRSRDAKILDEASQMRARIGGFRDVQISFRRLWEMLALDGRSQVLRLIHEICGT